MRPLVGVGRAAGGVTRSASTLGGEALNRSSRLPSIERIGMAGKSKKHRVAPISLGTDAKAQMVSQKVKKHKKTSRGK